MKENSQVIVDFQTIQRFIPQRMTAHFHQQGQKLPERQFPVRGKVFSRTTAELLRMLCHISDHGVQGVFLYASGSFSLVSLLKNVLKAACLIFLYSSSPFFKIFQEKAPCITLPCDTEDFPLNEVTLGGWVVF